MRTPRLVFRALPHALTHALTLALTLGLGSMQVACGPSSEPQSQAVVLQEKWLKRAKESYAKGDMDDAHQASDEARRIDPKSEDAKLIAARVALARLEFAEVLRATDGLTSSDARGLRGRALWGSGDIQRAADELEQMMRDPQVKDPWARDVAKLARRGAGRRPFTIEGGLVTAVEMPQAGSLLIVPCELEGEHILAVAATGVAELTLDSTSRKEPAWVSLRFGDRIEVKDVPALTADLSGLSKQLGAPIKALLGVNLLRHMHVTFDRRASQFVVRRDDPAAPPDASRVPLYYMKSGAMLLRTAFTKKTDVFSTLLLDTNTPYPLALSEETWKLAGVDAKSLRGDPQLPANLKTGLVPSVHIGAFDIPQVPFVQGVDLTDAKARVDVDLDGMMGAGFLQPFRVTFGDEGRFLWLEAGPMESALPEAPQAQVPQTQLHAPSAPTGPTSPATNPNSVGPVPAPVNPGARRP